MRELARTAWQLLRTPMAGATRTAVAFVIAAVMVVLGATAFMYGTADQGVTFAWSAESDQGPAYVVVDRVAPWSELDGVIRPGDAVVAINDRTWIPALAAGSGDGSVADPYALMAGEVSSFQTTSPEGLRLLLATGELPEILYWTTPANWWLDESGSAIALGIVILVGGGLWLLRGGAGPTLRRMAIPAVTAVAAPLVLVPVELTTSAAGFVAVALLLPLAQLPFADAITAEVEDPRRGGGVRLLALALTGAAIIAGLLVLLGGLGSPPVLAQWLAVGAIAGVAGLVASRPGGWRRPADGSPAGRVAESLELAALGVTPFIAMIALVAPNSPPLIFPLLLWLLALVAAQRITVRPFTRMATRATLQRDLVVAATEAERARIAADLHDVAVQDLTMLVRRLDARGETEDAEAARRVVEQLRTITGELRLPILDDLGVGPALDWLVGRLERLAGGEVRLERDDGTRLPPDVELAFFRVAQEGLANAVKHGRPPIVVRYRTSPTGATLTIDDAGPGIPSGAAEVAPASGHFGLLGMQQRAEQIGAILEVRPWPGGGTHVALDWRAP